MLRGGVPGMRHAEVREVGQVVGEREPVGDHGGGTVVQIDVQNPGDAAAAIEALRKVEAIASVRLVELGKL